MSCLKIVKLPHAHDLPLPQYQTPGSAGMDLAAALQAPIEILPGARALVATGLQIALETGYEAQIRPRSGLALKQGVTVLNAPGTIDSDYRGELKVLLINHGAQTVTIKHGARIAQMVIAPHDVASIEEVESLDETVRGAGGYGSTGV